MDVLKILFLIPFCLLLAQCGTKRSASSRSQFEKSEKVGCEGLRIQGEYLVVWKDGHVSVEKFLNDEAFVEDFVEKHKHQIKTSEPHYRVQLMPSVDLRQRGWGGEINWGMTSVEAESVWNKTLNNPKVVVAVIDSGLDISHPELAGVLAINENETANGLDDDGNGYIDDISGFDFVNNTAEMKDSTGHGTHVSGVISARHDVGEVLGVAPNVELLPLRFINASGGGQVDWAINAIRYAADNGARVINASWGGNGCSQPLQDEIAALASKNILFVTAAGNSGNDLSRLPEYPAAFGLDNIITVGASTFDDKTAEFSNYGNLVDIVAPGANIISTYPLEFDDDGDEDGKLALNGTSMAAPFVSAAAALLWSEKPEASYLEIKQALLAGAEPGPYPVETRGRLNIKLALDALNP